jgi:hypothetical protein
MHETSKKLKWSSSIFCIIERIWRKISLKKFIRYRAWCKYRKIKSSWDRYWVMRMKFTKTRMKFTTWSHLSIIKEVIIEIIYRTIIFCSSSIHCLISKNLKNVLRSIKTNTSRNRAFNLSSSDKFIDLIVCSLRLRLTSISIFRINWIQVKKCIIILLKNWCKMFIMIISWIFTKWWFQTKFVISWTQSSSFEFTTRNRCRWICLWVNSWVRSDHFLFRFFRFFDDTW